MQKTNGAHAANVAPQYLHTQLNDIPPAALPDVGLRARPAVFPSDCPRYDRCNAPLCPLDSDWAIRRHVGNDPVCGLALETVKQGAEARLGQYVRPEVLARVSEVMPHLARRSYGIRRALKRASESGSRLDNFRRGYD